MQRKKLAKLLKLIDLEIGKTERRVSEAKKVANEVAKTATTSWSAGGDREYAQSQSDILEGYYQTLKALGKEVGEVSTKELPKAIESFSYLKVSIDSVVTNFFLVSTPLYLPNTKMISADSLFGRSLVGKREGESYKLNLEGKEKTIVIIEVG
mgnify:FL=1